jgi:endonuclease/exonuclease/phosphatase (EEP) superfamily protein YafD
LEALGFILPWLCAPSLLLLPASLLRKSQTIKVLAAVPIAIFIAFYGHFYLPNRPAPHGHDTFKIMTYNIHYRNHNIQEIATEINNHQPDLLGVHELLKPAAELLAEQLKNQYPYQFINSAIGLFSKYPLQNCESFRMGYGTGYRAQKCTLELTGRHLTVYNVHPRSPYLPGEETAHVPFGQLQTTDLQDLLERIGKEDGPLLVMGDFNMSDQQSIYSQLTVQLHDAHVDSGWGQGFTFTGWPKSDIAVWRIDYILYTPDLVSIRTGTGRSGNSDHRPLFTTLAFR